MNLHLLFFNGCPNAETARTNLRKALDKEGLNLEWNEIDLESKSCPSQWSGFPSPTILINGQDIVTGIKEKEGSTACQKDGAPTIEHIIFKLREEIKR